MPPIVATGAKTIVDLSDGKSLTAYLGSNQPKTQVYNPNTGGISPDWTSFPVILTPVVYLNQTAVALNAAGLTITWKRKEGSGAEANLSANETVTNNILTVNANKLNSVTSGLLTYIIYVAYVDPDTQNTINAVTDISFAQVKTGTNAKLVWITGDQVFKYDTAGAVSPTQITLTANLSEVTVSKWQYYTGSAWADYPTTGDNANITSQTLNVKPTHAVFINDTARIKVLTSDANVSDITTIARVRDGAQTSMAQLTNGDITFAANKDGQIATTTVYCNVMAYTGTTKVTPTIGTVTGAPSGMTVTPQAASNNEIPLKIDISSNATLGGSGQLTGALYIPVTSPVSTTLLLTWSKVNTGATGGTGASGQNAVLFSLYAPNGSVFVNQGGTLTIQSVGYNGSTQITSGATYVWKKYTSGSWTTISGQTGNSLTVDGTDVIGIQAYQCTMTYATKTYTDTITLIDKTDNYQATIDSTGGDVFKNTVGFTHLICRLWQNAAEVDAQKSVVIATSDPGSPATGDFYYKYSPSTPQVALMRYSGSAWVDVTANATYKHTKTYTWYRRDKNGNGMDEGAAFATGKIIYVDGDDVEDKTTFTCEVS